MKYETYLIKDKLPFDTDILRYEQIRFQCIYFMYWIHRPKMLYFPEYVYWNHLSNMFNIFAYDWNSYHIQMHISKAFLRFSFVVVRRASSVVQLIWLLKKVSINISQPWLAIVQKASEKIWNTHFAIYFSHIRVGLDLQTK